MRKLLSLFMAVMLALCADAAAIKLADGRTLTYTSQTEPILYNSYRVTVLIDESVDYNVWGEVILMYQGRTVESKPLFIKAGQTSCDVDFEGLDNGVRYRIVVKVKNK